MMKNQISRLKPLAASVSLLLAAGHAGAVGVGTVAGGAATIGTSGTTTTINQSTDRAIVNWNNFNIGANETVQINQPNAKSAILNRVNSANSTQIDGALNANGRVFVINPNGVVVGKTGTINANGVVLSTLDVSDGLFMRAPTGSGADVLQFRKAAGAANAAVVNDGTINAGNGGVSLFGSQVINGATGAITAKGDALINAGDTGLSGVNLVASNSIDLYQNKGAPDAYSNTQLGNYVPDGLVANDGTIKVDAGNVTLLSQAGVSTSNETLRNTGAITATAATTEVNGRFYPVGGTVGITNNGEGLATHVGGSIDGQNVNVAAKSNTLIDGTINAVNNLSASAYAPNKDAVLTVADNAKLNGNYVAVSGDYVTVDGNLTAGVGVQVTGGTQATVREGALNAPDWTITSAGTTTTGKGQNGAPVYGADGYDQYGYDRNGYDRAGFDKAGYNAAGFDRSGFNAAGIDKDGYNRQGFNAQGYDRSGFNAQGFDKDGYNRQGFNIAGFGRDGFNAAGFDKDGYGRDGYNAAGFDRNGVARPVTGNPNLVGDPGVSATPNGNVWDLIGNYPAYVPVFGQDGFDQHGYNLSGMDRSGYSRTGYNVAGIDRNGVSIVIPGYALDAQGYDKNGYNAWGFNKFGYNARGYDAYGKKAPASLS
ncbi:MAG: filamentous hemagglutinin N-terminal domain-containing protein [Collimonas sp.]|uniref:filamentous hemagglutinin N-terminal domain-containing protein n=1 Tax=Collimonas sp. TaxID=1963772 RepID=UPI003264780B